MDPPILLEWHPSGRFAVFLTVAGEVVKYDAATASTSIAFTLPTGIRDMEVNADGSRFFVVGLDAAQGKLWPIEVDGSDQLSLGTSLDLAQTPVDITRQPGADTFVIAAQGSTIYINHLYLYDETQGVYRSKAFNASGGIDSAMWADPALYFDTPAIITSHGGSGSDSRTWTLQNDEVIENGWLGSAGNSGESGWRPDGGYGYTTGWSSNKLYVFNGAWSTETLPGVNTGASPQAIAWREDGSRALIVGRATGAPLQATVIDHRAGSSSNFSSADLVNASIPGFDQAPYFGTSSGYLRDVEWRPGSDCSEGLIVGAQQSTVGWLIRFYDGADPACGPTP